MAASKLSKGVQSVLPRMKSVVNASRIGSFSDENVWTVFTPLANRLKAVNLGQGFPGWEAPQFLKDNACAAIQENFNQYTRSEGHLNLVQELARGYSSTLKREIEPMSEVCVVNGCTEAVYSSLQGLVDPGDRVVMFSPFFDMYKPQIEIAGGVPVTVPMELVDSKWTFDEKELRRAVVDGDAKVLLLNSPHNPSGKVFTKSELETIAGIVRESSRTVVLSDEVYQFISYNDDSEYVSIAAMDGMAERTLVLSSSGKTFSVTGWKIGWCVGPSHLISCVQSVHGLVSFCTSTASQEAIARSLRQAEEPYEDSPSYYAHLSKIYRKKRDFLSAALDDVGLTPAIPEGSFFTVCDISGFRMPEEYESMEGVTRDWAFCLFLAETYGVVAIPMSPFYSEDQQHLSRNLVRFAFCKTDEQLEEAASRLQGLSQHRI
uniref:Aminotransferase class I/classII large domain-containing protein n=1 Tax=Lotharella globosa TaxID=91324 RepID=A0A7S3YS97_9EUKA